MAYQNVLADNDNDFSSLAKEHEWETDSDSMATDILFDLDDVLNDIDVNDLVKRPDELVAILSYIRENVKTLSDSLSPAGIKPSQCEFGVYDYDGEISIMINPIGDNENDQWFKDYNYTFDGPVPEYIADGEISESTFQGPMTSVKKVIKEMQSFGFVHNPKMDEDMAPVEQ